MESVEMDDSCDTQYARMIKRKLLGDSQSESYPHTQFHGAVQPASLSPTKASRLQQSHIFDSQPDETRIRRATTSQDHVPPLLVPSKSNPITLSSDKKTTTASKMWNSFAGLPHEDIGDTQPVDTQTFVEYSDINTSRSHTNGRLEGMDERTSSTKAFGQNGTSFINLTANVEEAGVDSDDVSSIASDVDELSPETKIRLEKAFKVPKTPATNGRKRNARGEIVSSQARTSATRTPGSALAAMFGNGNARGPGMSLSQVFMATQAASSPLPDNGPRSDPVFDRPSPNLHKRISSPNFVAMHYSSPVRPSTADATTYGRIPTDPLDTYIPMDESQEERARRFRQEREQQLAESLEDDEFDDSMTGVQWRLQQKKIHRNALTSAAELTAPDRRTTPGSRPPSKIARRRSATDISTPSRPLSSHMKNRNMAIHSDVTNIFSDTEEVPNVEEAGVEEVSDVKKESANSQDITNGVRVPETSPNSRTHSQPNDIFGTASHQRSPTKSQKGSREYADALTTSQKSIVVEDSQAERNKVVEGQNSPDRPAAEITSSSISSNIRVTQTQSQYSSLKPEHQALMIERVLEAIDTSSVPCPLASLARVRREERIPSSPPIAARSGSQDDDDDSLDELADDEVHLIGPGDAPPPSTSSGDMQQLIPEIHFDKLGHGADQLQSSRPGDLSEPRDQTETAAVNTNGTDDFATARSHLSPSINSRTRDSNSDSKRIQVGGIRRFADLSIETAPTNSIESADVDFNILTEADEQFHNIMSGSSPVRPHKRIKVYGRAALQEPAKKANIPTPDTPHGAPGKELQLSPKVIVREFNAPRSTPVYEQIPTPTPQSTKRREEKGAHAATHARQAMLSKNDKLISKNKSHSRQKKTMKKNPVPTTTPSSSGRPRPRSLKILENARTSVSGSTGPHQHKANQRSDIPAQRHTSKARAGRLAAVIQSEPTILHSNSEEEPESCPNRVLAMYKQNMASYPATVIGLIQTDGVRFRIRFDDGNEDILDSMQIRKLDLRVGDWVKVDLPKMKTKSYIIIGFSSKISPDALNAAAESTPYTDIYGHQIVRLCVKPRESIPTPLLTSAETFEIPVTNIYVTRTMMSNFADRKFSRHAENMLSRSRLSTPSHVPSAPSTPSSRSRRQVVATDLISTAVPADTESNIFANMAFAVTFSNNHLKEKNTALKSILNHGARLLESGFNELFDIDAFGVPKPKKSSPDSSTDPDSLHLTPEARNLGFTALIADGYCRRAKYIQALALSIPCLHYRWLTESIAASMVLPFQKYLLPAGESTFLSGAVRSRTLAPYDPRSEEAKLKNVLSRRDLLLGGESVLFVVGKGKTEAKRKVHLFLTYALGAGSVGRVLDLAGVKTELKGEKWDLVYVDGEVGEAAKVLFGKEGAITAKKRKRESAVGEAGEGKLAATGLVRGEKVMVVSDEFVVQSLILGGLMEG